MNNLYAQYIKEREDYECIEIEHGFAVYKKIDPDAVYLKDIFVEKEFRKAGIATELSKQVALIAKELGCTKLIGSVCLGSIGVTVSMKALLGDGFQFSHTVGNMLYFSKVI